MSDTAPAPLRLLLLEDSAFDAELLQEALRNSHPHARCVLATSRAAFERAWRPAEFDAVLSDYDVPGFGGIQALEVVRRDAPLLPFIFVSGVIGEDNAVELLRRGATDYVSKNRLERLPLVLDRALREAAQRRAREAAETRLHDAIRQAEAARREAEKASRAKDRFIAVLSHELRAPLAAVASAIHMLDKTAIVPERYRDLIPVIRRNVAIEARLIDDLLDISAISSGKLTVQRDIIDLHAVVRDAVRMLADPIAERGLRLELALEPGVAAVDGDAVRLQQVVTNLVRNAVKFSLPGGHIHLSTRRHGTEIVLQCRDDGVGIAPEALERIFVAFEQAGDAVAREHGGLGLGLAIARYFVHEHGGTLQASSAGPCQGACFTLSLPLAEGDVTARPAAVDTVQAGDARAPQPTRVLLVEDHIGAAEVLRMCLEDYGYEVMHAATVGQALQIAQASAFDIVLTDLGLPDASGVEVGRALSARMPVVALSGFGADGDLRSTAAAGFAGHLVKPVEPEQIHAMLQRVLAERTASSV